MPLQLMPLPDASIFTGAGAARVYAKLVFTVCDTNKKIAEEYAKGSLYNLCAARINAGLPEHDGVIGGCAQLFEVPTPVSESSVDEKHDESTVQPIPTLLTVGGASLPEVPTGSFARGAVQCGQSVLDSTREEVTAVGSSQGKSRKSERRRLARQRQRARRSELRLQFDLDTQLADLAKQKLELEKTRTYAYVASLNRGNDRADRSVGGAKATLSIRSGKPVLSVAGSLASVHSSLPSLRKTLSEVSSLQPSDSVSNQSSVKSNASGFSVAKVLELAMSPAGMRELVRRGEMTVKEVAEFEAAIKRRVDEYNSMPYGYD